ncbi:MAG TPA: NAD(P)-dependent oxidoreductase [Niabella sp.]|uniref:NAD-dependent epimerase/dehydratase family protein n=1 Tax=Agriterribacter sp. TaxID=2821509 RepID=UPI002C843147|nr:NAD(P)-dependent oxidoreductase [Agriterribacter sp.]HRO85730.1 NAD(P)-dependent oxidoreductase [Niabella sp.]HRP54958.1 NAD(P)-dependent oxidoreductase [Agriterribacter sp.]
MQKVLVTGATGFIGNYVVEALLKRNYHVIASSGNEATAKQKNWFTKAEYLPLDLKSLKESKNYFEFFGKPDIMIHLSWEGLPNYKDDFHLKQNLPRHKTFLENIIRNGLKNINITGTCLEYGMREGKLSEAMQPLPRNAYAQAKNELRMFIEDLKESYSFGYKWIRLFYMFGKGQNAKSLLSQLQQALDRGDEIFNMSGGEQTRDFLHVEKVAEYIVDIALQTKVSGIINCCSGIPVTVKQVVQQYLQSRNAIIKLNLGYYPYPDYEPMHFWGDNSLLKQIINKMN